MANVYVSNDNLLQVLGLMDEAEGNFLNDATVTAVVTDSSGNTLTSLSLDYIIGSQGDYQGTLLASISWVALQSYTVTVTATRGGITAVWEIPVIATHRE
jgi:hypothetical protein